jgi:hypothetical protein
MNANGKGSNGSEHLAAIDRRIAAAMQKRAAEKERLRKHKAKENEHLFKTVGEICCNAAERPDFGPALKAVLETETDQKTRAFLRQKGIL